METLAPDKRINIREHRDDSYNRLGDELVGELLHKALDGAADPAEVVAGSLDSISCELYILGEAVCSADFDVAPAVTRTAFMGIINRLRVLAEVSRRLDQQRSEDAAHDKAAE